MIARRRARRAQLEELARREREQMARRHAANVAAFDRFGVTR